VIMIRPLPVRSPAVHLVRVEGAHGPRHLHVLPDRPVTRSGPIQARDERRSAAACQQGATSRGDPVHPRSLYTGSAALPLSHVRPQNARPAVSPAPLGSHPPERHVSNSLCAIDPLIRELVTHNNDCRRFAAGSLAVRRPGLVRRAVRRLLRTADRKLSGNAAKPGSTQSGILGIKPCYRSWQT
jgi:hypothetical protein